MTTAHSTATFRYLKGHEVEEVEGPFFLPALARVGTANFGNFGAPRLTRAHAYARVTSEHKSLYPDYGN